MSCDDLFREALRWSGGPPVRWYPKCHPKAACNVFIDGKNKTVTVSCAKCDRPMGTFKLKSGTVTNGKPL